jgi:hypothetical protein
MTPASVHGPSLSCASAGTAQVPRGVAEAGDLLGLGRQVRNGVEDQVDECVVAGCGGGGHIGGEHRAGGFVGFDAQLVDHRLGQFDAGDGYATRGQRDRDAAGADREFQRRTVAGERGEAIGGRVENFGGEHAGNGRVVALSGFGVPDFVLAHRASFGRRIAIVQKLFRAVAAGLAANTPSEKRGNLSREHRRRLVTF